MINLSKEELESLVNLKNNNCMLVIFYAEWCSPSLLQINDFEISNIEKKFANKCIEFYKFNIDNGIDLVKKFQAHTLPCILMFINGELIERVYGYQQIEYLEAYAEMLVEELEKTIKNKHNHSI